MMDGRMEIIDGDYCIVPLLSFRKAGNDNTNHFQAIPDSKVHGANMGPTWVLSAPDGPHVGPMNLAIREVSYHADCPAIPVPGMWNSLAVYQRPPLGISNAQTDKSPSKYTHWQHSIIWVNSGKSSCNSAVIVVQLFSSNNQNGQLHLRG